MKYLIFALICGCVNNNAPPIRQVTQQLRDDQPGDIDDYFSSELKNKVDKKKFNSEWPVLKRERAAQVKDLQKGRGTATAAAVGPGGVVSLIREAGGWRLVAPLIRPRGSESPQAAMRVIAQSLRKGDWRNVVQMMSRTRRSQVGKVVLTLLSSLDKNVETAFTTITGPRADVRWIADEVQFRLVFIREDNQWKLDDIHIRRLDERQSIFE